MKVALRRIKTSDAESLASMANNKKIWLNLRDAMPHPYRLNDALNYISFCNETSNADNFIITYEDVFCGCVGINKQNDIYRHSAEIGYWIGEEYWGKGIATEAVRLMVDYCFSELKLTRLFTSVYANNIASAKVLEKNGFEKEGLFKKGVLKDGKLIDEVRYGLLNPDSTS